MITEKLTVKGMHCKSCVMLVEEAVEEIKGVENVKANFEANTVEVTYDGTNTTLEEIKQAIKDEGYKV